MPTRILLRLLLLAGLAAPICAFALGIGSLEVRSALDQNFEAEIPLIVNNPAELTNLKVQLPRQQAFDAVGIERLEFMSKLRFSVQTSPNGPSVIKITSIEPIREPNFNLLVDLTWSHGHLLREFPVQLDPSLYVNRRRPPPPPEPIVAPPPIVAAPAEAAKPVKPAAGALPPAPPVSFEGASPYGPVKPGETLATIARQVRPSPSIALPQMMSILVAGNPGAFTDGNPSSLRAGAMLKVPTAQALGVSNNAAPAAPAAPPSTADATAATVPAAAAETAALPAPEAPPATAATTTPAPAAEAAPPAVPPVAPPEAPSTAAVPLASLPASPDQPRELFPQSSLPQTSASTPPAEPAAPAQPIQPAAPAAPVETAAKPPEPAKPSPASKPLPLETEPAWWGNPVVWVAILLIVLAVVAVLLLPLLRRPARPKAAVAGEGADLEQQEAAVARAATSGSAPDLPKTRPQLRDPNSKRPLPATPAAATEPPREGAAASTKAVPKPDAAAKPAAASPPKPIEELLKDIDFGLEDRPPPMTSGKGATPGLKLETKPLPDVEPSTASITREPAAPPEPTPPPPVAKPELPPLTPPPRGSSPPPPKDPPTELPSALRFDDLDFSFGDLGLEQTERPSNELPPLEMKPAGAKKPTELPPLSFGDAKPSAGPAVGSPKPADSAAPAAAPAAADLKFEFSDVTQAAGKTGSQEELRKLEEELRGFGVGDGTLSLGKMDVSLGQDSDSGVIGADYVDTKLDLATTFLDMGDQVGARSLLEDVLREGDAAQKKRAGELLKKMG